MYSLFTSYCRSKLGRPTSASDGTGEYSQWVAGDWSLRFEDYFEIDDDLEEPETAYKEAEVLVGALPDQDIEDLSGWI
jgi:hypothetical protein